MKKNMPKSYQKNINKFISFFDSNDKIKIDNLLDKRSILMIFGKINNKKVVLKAVLKNIKQKVFNYHKEFIISEILGNVKNITRVIKKGTNDDFFWIIREFFDGQSFSAYEHAPLGSYDKINNNLIKYKNEFILNIHNFVKLLQKIDVSGCKKYDKYFKLRFENAILKSNVKKVEKLFNIDLINTLKFYNLNFENYNKQRPVFCHGDFNPSNIILTNKNQIVFTDFEWAGIDNEFMDISFMWLFLWRLPDWQKDLIDEIILNGPDKTSFRMCVIRQLIGWYAGVSNIFESGNQEYFDEYQNHIWLKYLVAAGESFETLINVKK